MIHKDTYIELFNRAAELDSLTKALKRFSIQFYVYLLVSIVIPLLVLLLLFFQAEHFFLLVKLILYILLLVYIVFSIKTINDRYNGISELYKTAQHICWELTDDIDWNTMRKRQIHRPLNPSLQNPIDRFYKYSLSVICPIYGGNVLRIILQLILVLEFLFTFVRSVSFIFVELI